MSFKEESTGLSEIKIYGLVIEFYGRYCGYFKDLFYFLARVTSYI